MIGVVIVAHAPLGGSLLACGQHVYCGAPTQCRVVDVIADVEPAVHLEQVKRAVEAVDGGDGVLILVDLFGATPANIAAQLARPGQVEVVAGLNLPMLLKVLCYRDAVPLSVMVEKAVAGGSAGVMKVGTTPPQDQQRYRQDPNHPRGHDGDTRLHDQQ